MKKYSLIFITLLSVVLLFVSCTKQAATKDDQDADNDPRDGSKWEIAGDIYDVQYTNPVDVSGYSFDNPGGPSTDHFDISLYARDTVLGSDKWLALYQTNYYQPNIPLPAVLIMLIRKKGDGWHAKKVDGSVVGDEKMWLPTKASKGDFYDVTTIFWGGPANGTHRAQVFEKFNSTSGDGYRFSMGWANPTYMDGPDETDNESYTVEYQDAGSLIKRGIISARSDNSQTKDTRFHTSIWKVVSFTR